MPSSNVTWAISDSDLSPNNDFLLHSTLNPIVSMFDIKNMKYTKRINLQTSNNSFDENDWMYRLRIFSIKISGDNNTFLAGTSVDTQGHAYLKLYDLER